MIWFILKIYAIIFVDMMCVEGGLFMSNPELNEKYLESEKALESAPMSVVGAINKTVILLICLLVPAIYTFSLVFAGFMDKAQLLTMGGALVGFIIALVMIFSRKPNLFKYLAPAYAVAEGFFVGGISAFFEASWTGIVLQAIIATLVTVFFMLALFRAKIIRATEKLRSVIVLSTVSVAAIYIIQMIASAFGRSIPQIFTASPIGIGFSIFVVVIAALNLILDFDFIQKGEENMLDKEYEWYGAFGLMVTIVWLYIEMLKLLAKLSSRE